MIPSPARPERARPERDHPLRIALLTHSTNPRGGVAHALFLAEALLDLGHRPVVFAPDPGGRGFYRPSRADTVPLPAAPLADASTYDLVRTRMAEIIAWFTPPERRAFDVFHAQDGISSNALASLKAQGLIPGFARTVHHVDSFDDTRVMALQARSILRADAHFAVSDLGRTVLARDFDVEATVVGNGVDTALFSPTPDARDAALRLRLGLSAHPAAPGASIREADCREVKANPRPPLRDGRQGQAAAARSARPAGGVREADCREVKANSRPPLRDGRQGQAAAARSARPAGGVREADCREAHKDSPLFLAVGGVEARKNTLNILRAFGEVLISRPDARLVIAGGASLLNHHGYQAAFRAALDARPDVARHVVLAGPVAQDELPALYRLADALVFPSVQEGFGLVAIEAIACGTPVITARTPPFTEHFRDDQVLWCAPQVVQTIADAMVLALRPETRARLSKGRTAVIDAHRWSRTAAAHLATYHALSTLSPVRSPMPEMRFTIRWPDGRTEGCYSPSLIIKDYFAVGADYPVADFLDRSRTALTIASDRVAKKYGFACSSAADQLARIEDGCGPFLDQENARVTVESFQE